MSRSYERYLAKSNLIKPFKHGHLDRLSAVYSVINAIRWAAFENAPISDVGANMLFQHILSQFDKTYKIGDIGLFDIGMPEWANLVKSALRYSETQFAFRAQMRAVTNNPSYAKNIHESLENGSVVLSRLTGPTLRFSVICAMDDYRCFLFDSGIRKFVRKTTLLSVSSSPILFEINVW